MSKERYRGMSPYRGYDGTSETIRLLRMRLRESELYANTVRFDRDRAIDIATVARARADRAQLRCRNRVLMYQIALVVNVVLGIVGWVWR